MSENRYPGVFIEETEFRSKPIEGVSTHTTSFVGAARYGEVDFEPDMITSLGEYESLYGDGRKLQFEGQDASHNYLWHSVRAFFEEGGKRLYVARIFRPLVTDDGAGNVETRRVRHHPHRPMDGGL
ncbi:MAG TPA: hypothetical protein VGO96_10610 [Pyrinomonadaceae bacterium]|jgi:hypothetical protein|nr:hypothetical protein [Pyrinomonadaceae bacterium]